MDHADELFRTVSRLPPSELAAFEAVVRHGGFRAAARSIGGSASALSHAVSSLEGRLNRQLLLRSTRAISLTQAGQRFLDGLRPALLQLGDAVTSLSSEGDEPTGTIRMTSSEAAVELIIQSALVPFMRATPEVMFDIRSDAAFVDIAKEGFDCGLRLVEQVPSDMVAVPIGADQQQHIVVGAPDYLATAPALQSPFDLAQHSCVQLRLAPGSLYRWEFTRAGEAMTVRTSGRLVVDSTRLALEAAVGGLGLAYVTHTLAADELRAGRVVQVLGEWTPPYPGLALYYPRHKNLGPAMRALINFLRAR